MDTGRIKWRFTSGRSEPSPLIRNGVAYFGTANGEFYALDLERRRPRWVLQGASKITGSPALVGNRIYFGDYSGIVWALNARTGRVVWTGSAGSRVYGTVAVSGGRVFAPSVFSGLSALSARTGNLLWRVPVGHYLYSSPAVYRNRVYFGTYESLVYCVNARSGRVLWTRVRGRPRLGRSRDRRGRPLRVEHRRHDAGLALAHGPAGLGAGRTASTCRSRGTARVSCSTARRRSGRSSRDGGDETALDRRRRLAPPAGRRGRRRRRRGLARRNPGSIRGSASTEFVDDGRARRDDAPGAGGARDPVAHLRIRRRAHPLRGRLPAPTPVPTALVACGRQPRSSSRR